MKCPACGAKNAPVGVLGHLVHYCCRMCGLWFAKERKAKEVKT